MYNLMSFHPWHHRDSIHRGLWGSAYYSCGFHNDDVEDSGLLGSYDE